MRIIQITDLHIYPEDKIINGVDTRKNLLKVLKVIGQMRYDLVVLTGDLSFTDGDASVYNWIKTQLDKHGICNYHVIGGNHDNAEILAEVFDKKQYLHADELYYFVKPNIIFLDTIKGFCSKGQLEWFAEKISGLEGQHPVIFMHHPPFKSGVPHMDRNYAFQQPEKFLEICKTNMNTIFVFIGHYHNEKSIVKENVNLFITPSTYMQIDMLEEDFKEYHTYPAFRIIDIDDSQLLTTVRYVFD